MNTNTPYEVNGHFDFDLLERKVKKVKYEGKWYELREASEQAAIRYNGQNLKGMQVVNTGGADRLLPSEASSEADLILVSNCLYEEGTNKQVPESKLRNWKHEVIDVMAEWVKDNSVGMRPKNTRQVLEDEIARLQKKLAELNEVNPEVMAKNSSDATAVISG